MAEVELPSAAIWCEWREGESDPSSGEDADPGVAHIGQGLEGEVVQGDVVLPQVLQVLLPGAVRVRVRQELGQQVRLSLKYIFFTVSYNLLLL